ncbi:MAG: NAD(P)/FAD-dependent oxidoreductase [Pseudomonadota bacterium]
MSLPASTQVLVAGAGPVGTVAAYWLASHGIDVVIAEAGPDCAADLRASTFHPPTLEMLQQLGIAGEITASGLKAPVYHFRERQTGEAIAFDMRELSDRTAFPFRVQCEQYIMARLLAERLQQHAKARVLFGHRVVAFEQLRDEVDVALESSTAIHRIKAKYVIAADGGNSIVRKWLNAGFDGFTYPEKFLCLSTEQELADYLPNLAYVNYVSDPEEWQVLLRAPSAWRILVPADEKEPDENLVNDANRDRVFDRLIGETGVETLHRTIYRVHQRVVQRMDHGRVFLVGDAAHLNNPLGGFGMNSGIHDVWNLCPRIETALSRGHDAESFAQFDRQRRAVTHAFIQAQTIRNKAFLEHGAAVNHEQSLQNMRATAANEEERIEFLLRQAMFRSLEDAAAIR